MAKVIKNANVHEKTVQAAARPEFKGWKGAGAARRALREKIQKKAHWYDGLDVDLLAYIRENNIYPGRVQIVSPTEIIIHNNTKWRGR